MTGFKGNETSIGRGGSVNLYELSGLYYALGPNRYSSDWVGGFRAVW